MQTITVTTLAESADGFTSLRDAIALANQQSGAVTILFDPSLKDGTINLSLGELVISGDVTINGDIDGDGAPHASGAVAVHCAL